jgi:predicted acylesterase/phospholipase RssA
MTQFMTHKGLVSSDCFHQLLVPFFNAYDIPITITLKELYDRTNTDFHIFTTSVRDMISVDLNHITFPELSVITAVSMSSSVPLLFTPVQFQDEYYMDGGVLKHCPVPEVDPETLLVILIDYKPEFDLSSTTQFMQHILVKCCDIISSNTSLPICKYLFRYNSTSLSITPSALERVLRDKNYRSELIDVGKNHSIDFIKKN